MMRVLLFFSISILSFYSSASAQKRWTLRECAEHAKKYNLQIIASQYARDVQKKKLSIARRQGLPSLSLSISGDAHFGHSEDALGKLFKNDAYTNDVKLSSQIQLYNHGNLEKRIKKSKYELEASSLDIEAHQDDMVLDIIYHYLQVLLNKEIYKISEEVLGNAEKQYQKALITTKVGTTSLAVEYEAKAVLAKEEQNFRNAKIEIERSLFDLSQLLQLEEYRDFDIDDQSFSGDYSILPLPEDLSVEDILEKAYELQPRMKASEFRLKAALMQSETIRDAFYPLVVAGLGVGSFYQNSLVLPKNTGFLKGHSNHLSEKIDLSVSIPIFNKGITRLELEQAKIGENIATNELSMARNKLRQNIQKAYFEVSANYEKFLAAQESEKSAELSLIFTRKSYDAGRVTIFDLNNVRNNWIRAKSSVFRAKYNYIFSLKVLNFYMGGDPVDDGGIGLLSPTKEPEKKGE